MANVIVTHSGPNPRYAALADAIGNFSKNRDIEEQRRLQQEYQSQLINAQRAKVFFDDLATLPADQRPAAIQNMDPALRPFFVSRSGLPPHQPTSEEIANDNWSKYKAGLNLNDPTKPVIVDPLVAGIFDPKLASAKPFMDVAAQRQTYNSPSTMPPGTVEAQRILDKLDEDANSKASRVQQGEQWGKEFSSIKLPESKVKLDSENALTKERTATAGLRGAETQKVQKEIQNSYGSGQGSNDPRVMNILKPVIEGKVSLDTQLGRIKDKNLHGAVLSAAVDNGVAGAQELTQGAQNSLSEIQPVKQQFEELIKKFEPYKNINTPGYFAFDRAKYALGVESPAGNLSNEIANLEMSKITGAMKYATKSRNFKYIEQIQDHLPKVWKDSPALIYDKLNKAVTQFNRFEEAESKYNVKGATSASIGASAPGAATYKIYALGPDGHKIGSNDDQQTWFDVATGKRVQ